MGFTFPLRRQPSKTGRVMQPAPQVIHQISGMEEKKVTKQSRKERLKEDDAFTQVADEASVWLDKHRNLAIGALALVVALIVVGLAVQQVGHRRDVHAGERFAAGFRALDGRVLDPNKANAPSAPLARAQNANHAVAAGGSAAEAGKTAADAEPGEAAGEVADADDDEAADASRLTFPSDKARWQAAHAAFADAEASRGHKGVGALAGLLAADLEARLGQQEVAEKHFDALRRDLKGDARLWFLAVERFAYLREAEGDVDGALAALDELAHTRRHFYADRATMHQARLYAVKGETAKAIALLEAMQQDFPGTELGEEISQRLEALNGSGMGTGSAPQGTARSATDVP
jgi:hypothetical protein